MTMRGSRAIRTRPARPAHEGARSCGDPARPGGSMRAVRSGGGAPRPDGHEPPARAARPPQPAEEDRPW